MGEPEFENGKIRRRAVTKAETEKTQAEIKQCVEQFAPTCARLMGVERWEEFQDAYAVLFRRFFTEEGAPCCVEFKKQASVFRMKLKGKLAGGAIRTRLTRFRQELPGLLKQLKLPSGYTVEVASNEGEKTTLALMKIDRGDSSDAESTSELKLRITRRGRGKNKKDIPLGVCRSDIFGLLQPLAVEKGEEFKVLLEATKSSLIHDDRGKWEKELADHFIQYPLPEGTYDGMLVFMEKSPQTLPESNKSSERSAGVRIPVSPGFLRWALYRKSFRGDSDAPIPPPVRCGLICELADEKETVYALPRRAVPQVRGFINRYGFSVEGGLEVGSLRDWESPEARTEEGELAPSPHRLCSYLAYESLGIRSGESFARIEFLGCTWTTGGTFLPERGPLLIGMIKPALIDFKEKSLAKSVSGKMDRLLFESIFRHRKHKVLGSEAFNGSWSFLRKSDVPKFLALASGDSTTINDHAGKLEERKDVQIQAHPSLRLLLAHLYCRDNQAQIVSEDRTAQATNSESQPVSSD